MKSHHYWRVVFSLNSLEYRPMHDPRIAIRGALSGERCRTAMPNVPVIAGVQELNAVRSRRRNHSWRPQKLIGLFCLGGLIFVFAFAFSPGLSWGQVPCKVGGDMDVFILLDVSPSVIQNKEIVPTRANLIASKPSESGSGNADIDRLCRHRIRRNNVSAMHVESAFLPQATRT